MNKRHGFSPPVTGGSSLLVIFSVLCLTVFALLSLATVRADDWLSQTSAGGVEAYYAADVRAEEILALLRCGEIPEDGSVEAENTAGGIRYAYECPISETQALSVLVEVRGVNDYTVLRWKAISTADWAPDDSIVVWDGGVMLWN